jgi:glycosyltransferase involved in cell wall biosynthesis
MVSLAAEVNQRLLLEARSPWLLMATSKIVADALQSGGYPRAKVRIRPNYLFDSPEASLAPGKGVVYAGRLSKEKGIEWLLQVWSNNPSLPEMKFIGAGPLTALVAEAAAKDERVVLGDPLTHDMLLKEMSRAALVVVPSNWEEPFGRVAIESLAVGTPVLSSNRGALPEVVGDAGLSLALSDEDEWGRAIERLTGSIAQKALRVVARQRFETMFDRDAAVNVLEPILEELMSQ